MEKPKMLKKRKLRWDRAVSQDTLVRGNACGLMAYLQLLRFAHAQHIVPILRIAISQIGSIAKLDIIDCGRLVLGLSKFPVEDHLGWWPTLAPKNHESIFRTLEESNANVVQANEIIGQQEATMASILLSYNNLREEYHKPALPLSKFSKNFPVVVKFPPVDPDKEKTP
ncbi:hypothetical protein PG984_008291 [Apiospora sp. TS-2023a]